MLGQEDITALQEEEFRTDDEAHLKRTIDAAFEKQTASVSVVLSVSYGTFRTADECFALLNSLEGPEKAELEDEFLTAASLSLQS